ncbi:hypothetical protein DS884_00030 [Tenacibaculum sp. E3R01]|uniref:amino acid adenylation domain-containing protein n=1 Tax=Tenacibaculum sp. E3R01 TaxID=2267227 RepID=UPI000DE8453F|nr:amino acid adenylation domain-containing protein [Tenacibaculum sp. E3R01]RBW63464.1 hypothetical protein DS884_00030 [Tenacibaculum sp. E3R01]
MQYSFNSNRRLEEHFKVNAKKFPKKVAISCKGVDLTYEELDQKSDLIANLVMKNLKEDTQYVGLLMNRGLEMVISILGILKAGVAYIPIDPVNNPTERIKLCLSEVNLNLLITDRVIDIKNVKTLLVEKDILNEQIELSRQEIIPVKKSEIAYAIFTSGTTGIPKAVPIIHENVLNMFHNSQEIFEFSKDDVWALFHSIAFDFSVWEIWGTLLYGAKLEIVPFAVAKNTARFRRFLMEKKISVLNQTTGAFYSLIKADQNKETKIDSLRCLIFGGEKLDVHLLKPWVDRYSSTASKLITVYGTTETTIFTTFKYIGHNDIIDNKLSPIGEPIPGSDIILVGKGNEIATEGEIYISGERLSEGYLNRTELNETKFISKTILGETVKYYRTGDLAFEKNGEYYFLGRVDSQVKFNGYRIELEGIESVVMSHPKVMRSIVSVDKTLSHPRLISFLEPIDNLSIEDEDNIIDEVKSLVESLLPFYMVPSEFMFIDKIPLTVNGKIDHKELSELSKTY